MSLFRHEFLMGAVLYDAPVPEDQDSVNQTGDAQAVGDQERGLFAGDLGKIPI